MVRIHCSAKFRLLSSVLSSQVVFFIVGYNKNGSVFSNSPGNIPSGSCCLTHAVDTLSVNKPRLKQRRHSRCPSNHVFL
jgi:hypothetical protein